MERILSKIIVLLVGCLLGALAWMYITNPLTFKADAYCLSHGLGRATQVNEHGFYCIQDGLITHQYVDRESVNNLIQSAKEIQARTEERRRIFLEDRQRIEQQRQREEEARAEESRKQSYQRQRR